MAASSGPALCVVRASGPGQPRYLCYCDGPEAGGEGGFGVCVTDAADMWATTVSAHSTDRHVGEGDGHVTQAQSSQKSQDGLPPAEDFAARFRDACEQQTVSLTPRDDGSGVSLRLPGGPPGLTVDLPKLPDSEARPRLRALMLQLADRVRGLERRLAAVEAVAASPRKKSSPTGPRLFMPDPELRRGGPGTRKRMPGESLINPGFKSKKAPSGVDFDDS
ncbi:protein PAXX [Tachyglossus aculeatus]|uniref:protein PAXX n=1 Tax=Tachyglossus aculeatus TaxID=9261 RepID=UPI0018F46B78|nr:protein PAXX [Tachyglossus aculeatus]